VTSRIAAERDAKGFILDATGRSLVLAIPHQRAGQWLGSVYLYYDWANLLETSGFRGRFDPPGKKIALTPAGMAVCALDDEPPEPALLDRLDEHLKTYRTERGQYHLEDRGRSFQWATLSPFSVRVGVWYRDNRLGIPTVSLVLLLALLLFVAALFYLNYLVLTKEEEAGADGGDPEPLPMGEAPLSRDPQERFEASMEAHRASAAMEREFLGIPPAPLSAEAVEDPGDRARSAAREDLGERAEAALAELPELPDLTEDAEKLGAAPELPTLENLQEEIPSGVFAPRRREVPPSMEEDAPTLAPPEIPSEVFDSPPAADPKLSHLIDSVDSDLPAPVPRKVPKPAARAAAPRPKRVSAARMTLVQLAESIQKRKGIWSLKKQIAADLLNRYPRLREARIAVLIDNGEAHVPFQDHGLSSATRGRLSIPHGNKLWTSFLSRGKIVHIARHPEKSELLRRWFGPEDWKGVTQVAFIPVPSRQDGIFVTCLATGDDPTLPKKR
ncbi:MAG: hypothetical protein J0L75_19815, partial [Spirochaetes bacterium]|nr:hypothetical protein [Spirochaetota bacterium]